LGDSASVVAGASLAAAALELAQKGSSSLWKSLPTDPNSSLLKMFDITKNKEIKNTYFKNETIFLGGYDFYKCRFDFCTIICNSNNFNLFECTIDQTNKFSYNDEVITVVRFIFAKYPALCQAAPLLGPYTHPDGAITITKGQHVAPK